MTKFGTHMRIDLGMVPTKKIDLPTQGGRSENFRGSTIQKSGEFHELQRKLINNFFLPTKGGRSGNFRG